MKHLNHKIAALVLALVMALSLLPAAALAADVTVNEANRQELIDKGTISAKVYLLYENTIPSDINKAFSNSLFGPSGNGSPYFTVSVDLAKLLNDNANIDVYKTGSSYYISYQSGATGTNGYSADTLWTKILAAMSADDQAKFTAAFNGSYVGYVLKVESSGWHIDGVLTVQPPYFWHELSIGGETFSTFGATGTTGTTHCDTTLSDIETAFQTELAKTYGELTAFSWADGTFTAAGKQYTFTKDSSNNSVDADGHPVYTVKTAGTYYVATYKISGVTLVTTPTAGTTAPTGTTTPTDTTGTTTPTDTTGTTTTTDTTGTTTPTDTTGTTTPTDTTGTTTPTDTTGTTTPTDTTDTTGSHASTGTAAETPAAVTPAVTPAAETVIPDETAPLAETPVTAEAPAAETVIAEESAPLTAAPAAGSSEETSAETATDTVVIADETAPLSQLPQTGAQAVSGAAVLAAAAVLTVSGALGLAWNVRRRDAE